MIIIIIIFVLYYMAMIGVAGFTYCWHMRNKGLDPPLFSPGAGFFLSIFWPVWFIPFAIYAIVYNKLWKE